MWAHRLGGTGLVFAQRLPDLQHGFVRRVSVGGGGVRRKWSKRQGHKSLTQSGWKLFTRQRRSQFRLLRFLQSTRAIFFTKGPSRVIPSAALESFVYFFVGIFCQKFTIFCQLTFDRGSKGLVWQVQVSEPGCGSEAASGETPLQGYLDCKKTLTPSEA